MNMNQWQATAPSNIALIKYMGKTQINGNKPSNASLSYTLPLLLSHVRLTLIDAQSNASSDRWQPLEHSDCQPCDLSEKGQARFLTHLQRLKQHFNYDGCFLVESANTFAADCGLASSASSFAALTRVACVALSELTQTPLPSVSEQAALSQQGSGSSCRSFIEPWVLWNESGIEPIETAYPKLLHSVIVVEDTKKTVSSSEAHQRVTSSPLFENRIARAHNRLDGLITALQQADWRAAFEITWAEFQDMHALFATANPSFEYMTDKTLEILKHLEQHWQAQNDGPLVTLDAGPNIHLLFRPDQQQHYQQLENQFRGQWHGQNV